MSGIKNTIGTTLVKHLAEQGVRIFNIDTATKAGIELNIQPAYMPECLHYLKKTGWIESIQRGLYALTPALLSGSNISTYEIAMSIIKPATIAYWSAFHYHELTQQVPHKIFVLTTGSKLPRSYIGNNREVIINDIHYHFLSIKEQHYFGIEKVFYCDTQICITDLERTLLDGILRPKFCGGFGEVIEAYEIAKGSFDVPKIISYASKINDSACRRLGWMLDYLGITQPNIIGQGNEEKHYYIKLNASGDNKGRFNKKWGVRENI